MKLRNTEHKGWHRYPVAIALSALILGGVFSCKPKNGESDKDGAYHIGALYPMSGRAARYGEDSKAGAELALSEINADSAGPKIKITFRDSEAKADRAQQLAKEYILKDRVDFLMGVVSSSAALAVTQVSEKHQKIFVGTDHASSKLTYDKFQPYYFRVSNNTYQSMAAQAKYAAKQNWSRYYVIGPDYEYGHALWNDFRSLMEEEGKKVEVVGEAWPKLFEPDYTSYVSAIAAAKPDVIVANFWGGDAVAFLKQARASGILASSALISCDAGGNYEVFEALKEDMPNGLILSARHHNNWPPTERNREFVQKFKEKTGRFPTYAAEGAYVGVHFIAKSLRECSDPSDVEALVKTMEGLEISAPEDPEGRVSRMDPKTHQLIQDQAIGISEPNSDFPPASKMLGSWEVFPGEDIIPSAEEVAKRRGG